MATQKLYWEFFINFSKKYYILLISREIKCVTLGEYFETIIAKHPNVKQY